MATSTTLDNVFVTGPVPTTVPWDSPGSYHSARTCPGKHSEVKQLSIERAQSLGYTPCGRCL